MANETFDRDVDPKLFVEGGAVVSRPHGAGFNTGTPIAEMSNTELANAHNMSGVADPLAGHFAKEGDVAASAPRQKTQAWHSGDKFYHKVLKEEGTFMRMSDGKGIVKFPNRKEGKTSLENLVRL